MTEGDWVGVGSVAAAGEDRLAALAARTRQDGGSLLLVLLFG